MIQCSCRVPARYEPEGEVVPQIHLKGISPLAAASALGRSSTKVSGSAQPSRFGGPHQGIKLLQSSEAAPVPEILGNPVIDRERLPAAIQSPPRAGTTAGGVLKRRP